MPEVRLTPQQQAVVDNRGGTLLVSAAAGSGKTKVLVDRVLKQIIEEGKNISEFLIITFTNAAAAELHSKISSAISAELARQPENRHLARQMNLLHMSQISTVHAFCGALIRQFGYLLEIPADMRILEDGEKKEILERVIDSVLEDAYEKAQPDFLLLTDTLGAGRNDDALVSLIKNLYNKLESQPEPNKWIHSQNIYINPETDLTKTVWGQLYLEDCRRRVSWCIQRYRWAVSVMESDEKLSTTYLPGYQSQLYGFEQVLKALDGPWDDISASLSVEFARTTVRNYGNQELLDEIKDVKSTAKELLEEMHRLLSRPQAELIAEQNEIAPALSCLLSLTWDVSQRFSAEKRRKNCMDFADQEHLAIKLLRHPESGRPTDIAKEVSARFTEIMVDEYQDSNRVQEMIFTAICKPGDTNRFLVGDVKQSIYGFRQAEPELFLEKYKSFTPAETATSEEARKLVLSKNFRSRAEVLEAVNHVFENVMSEQVGDIEYGAEERLYEGLDTYPGEKGAWVELHVLELSKAGEQDETKYQKEAAWVTGRIAELLITGAPVRDGESVRPVRPGDIAVLFRSRDVISTYSKMLTKAGIPVSSDEGENLFETPEITVMVNLLKILENPHQDIPLLSVLCSPLFRVSNDQLAIIRSGSRQKQFYDSMRECNEPWCCAIVEKLEQMREYAASCSADVLVWQLLHEMDILAIYTAMDRGSARRENLLAFYEMARNAAGGQYLYLYQLIRSIDYAIKTGKNSASGASSGVILTTIHKSKGLEYPVVFLADTSRSFNFKDLAEPLLMDSELGIAAKIVDLKHKIRYPSLCFEALKRKAQRKALSEELRILYVAMTRAKDRLIMTYASQYAKSALSRLRPGAGNPAELWAAANVTSPGDWLLLSALSRVESGSLFEVCDRPSSELKVSAYPWLVDYHSVGAVSLPENVWNEQIDNTAAQEIPSPEQLIRRLGWLDSHYAASITPSKLTATQLKGRQKDQEAAERAGVPARMPQLKRPEFILTEQGLSATERGTAVHLFLQYANFTACTNRDGIIEELDRLCDERYLTELQAEAIEPERIEKLFHSEIGQRILSAKELIREFKFSILIDASEYYPETVGEKILLQGVVDAAILQEDGITVIDFKTDRVTSETAYQRALEYKGQLETYKKALGRIFDKPVKETVLYFLAADKTVVL